jgi:hypothetical protein
VRRRRAQFGPNSAAVGRLLDDLERLPTGEVAALAAAGGGVTGTASDDPDVAARAEVRARLRDIAVRGGRLDAIRAAGDEVAAWASSASHWFPAGVAGTLDATKEIGPRMAAVPIVLDAVYAVVLEDLLADWELDLLLAPWADVVGSPFGERAAGAGPGADAGGPGGELEGEPGGDVAAEQDDEPV